MCAVISNWFDSHYEKIWLIVMGIAIVLFVVAMLSRSEVIYDISEDVTDFYDEILSE